MLISDVAALLRLSAREAPAIVLERLVRESAREFFRKSRAWRITFSGQITSGSATYDITLPTGALAYDIISGKLLTSNVVLTYLRDAGKAYIDPMDVAAGTGSEYITLVENDKFTLLPDPIATEDIRLNIVMALSTSATEIDDAIYEEHEDAIRDGALYRLYETPMESWSNAKLSRLHHNKFLAATEAAKQRAEESGTPGVRSAKFSW